MVADGSKSLATHNSRVTVKLSDQLIWLRNVYYVRALHLDVMFCTKLD